MENRKRKRKTCSNSSNTYSDKTENDGLFSTPCKKPKVSVPNAPGKGPKFTDQEIDEMVKNLLKRLRSQHYKECNFDLLGHTAITFCRNDRCELCNSVTDHKGARWDHDHDVEGTGRCPFRARLCNICNLREGQIRAKVLKSFGLDHKKPHYNWTLVQRKMYFNQMLEKLPIAEQSLIEFLDSY